MSRVLVYASCFCFISKEKEASPLMTSTGHLLCARPWDMKMKRTLSLASRSAHSPTQWDRAD